MRTVVPGRGVVGMRTGGRAHCVVKHTTHRSLSGKGGVGARGLCVVKQTHHRLTEAFKQCTIAVEPEP